MTVRLGGSSWKPSLMCWLNRRTWSSHDRDLRKPAWILLSHFFVSARWYNRLYRIFSSTFTTHDVRLIGLKL